MHGSSAILANSCVARYMHAWTAVARLASQELIWIIGFKSILGLSTSLLFKFIVSLLAAVTLYCPLELQLPVNGLAPLLINLQHFVHYVAPSALLYIIIHSYYVAPSVLLYIGDI